MWFSEIPHLKSALRCLHSLPQILANQLNHSTNLIYNILLFYTGWVRQSYIEIDIIDQRVRHQLRRFVMNIHHTIISITFIAWCSSCYVWTTSPPKDTCVDVETLLKWSNMGCSRHISFVRKKKVMFETSLPIFQFAYNHPFSSLVGTLNYWCIFKDRDSFEYFYNKLTINVFFKKVLN